MLDAEKKLEQLARSLGAEAPNALLCGLVMVFLVPGRRCGEPGALPAECRDEAPGWKSEPFNCCAVTTVIAWSLLLTSRALRGGQQNAIRTSHSRAAVGVCMLSRLARPSETLPTTSRRPRLFVVPAIEFGPRHQEECPCGRSQDGWTDRAARCWRRYILDQDDN